MAASRPAGLLQELERRVAGGSVDGAAALVDGIERALTASHAALRAEVVLHGPLTADG